MAAVEQEPKEGEAEVREVQAVVEESCLQAQMEEAQAGTFQVAVDEEGCTADLEREDVVSILLRAAEASIHPVQGQQVAARRQVHWDRHSTMGQKEA